MEEPTTILQILTDAGLLGGTVILIWMLYTERLIPKGRLGDLKNVDELNDKTEALKGQLDDIEERLPARRR